MRIEDTLVLGICKKKKDRVVIENILQKKIDVDLLLGRIDKHLIKPFVLQELVKYSMPEQVKSTITAAAREAVIETALRNQMLRKEYAGIQAVFKEHGIECILMKGFSLDVSGIRTVGDLDILVKEKDLLVADKIVPLLSFEYVGDILNPLIRKEEKKNISLQINWNNQFQYYKKKNAVLLELHTNLFERDRAYEFDLNRLLDSIDLFWNRKQWNEILQTYVLSNEDLLLLMCLHTALKRSLYSNQFVLRNCIDIAGLVEREIDWDRVAAVSRDLDISSFVLFSLTLSARLLDVEVPDEILRVLDGHCTSGQRLCNAIHLRSFHDLGPSVLVYSNLYKFLVPFVYQKRMIPRLKRLFLLDLLFPPKRIMARFFKLSVENPLVYATYLLNPLRWVCLIGKRIISCFK